MTDGQFWKTFITMVAGLFVLTLFLIFLGTFMASDVNARLEEEKAVDRQQQIAERIAPAGSLVTGEESAAATASTASAGGAVEVAAADVSGEDVYGTACIACHGAGVAGAPKLGDAGAWSERIAQGMDTLLEHAIGGFQGGAGYMPPKGGNPALSDEQVRAAVEHMVENSR